MIPLAHTFIPGFDPAGPLEYVHSAFWLDVAVKPFVLLVVSPIVFWVAEGLVRIFAPARLTGARSLLLAIGVTAAVVVIPMGVTVSNGWDAPRYDAPTEAARWATMRYGTDLDPAEAEALLSDIKCGDGQESGRICTNTIRHGDGGSVTAQRVNDQIILVDSAENGEELPVTYGT